MRAYNSLHHDVLKSCGRSKVEAKTSKRPCILSEVERYTDLCKADNYGRTLTLKVKFSDFSQNPVRLLGLSLTKLDKEYQGIPYQLEIDFEEFRDE